MMILEKKKKKGIAEQALSPSQVLNGNEVCPSSGRITTNLHFSTMLLLHTTSIMARFSPRRTYNPHCLSNGKISSLNRHMNS